MHPPYLELVTPRDGVLADTDCATLAVWRAPGGRHTRESDGGPGTRTAETGACS